MTINEKYLDFVKNLSIQKIIDTCSPTLKIDQNLAYIALFKEDIGHKMREYFTRHFRYGFRYAAHLKKNCVSLMKSLRCMPENLETVTLVV